MTLTLTTYQEVGFFSSSTLFIGDIGKYLTPSVRLMQKIELLYLGLSQADTVFIGHPGNTVTPDTEKILTC